MKCSKEQQGLEDPMHGGLHQATHLRAKITRDTMKTLRAEKPIMQFRSMALNPNLKTHCVPQTNV